MGSSLWLRNNYILTKPGAVACMISEGIYLFNSYESVAREITTIIIARGARSLVDRVAGSYLYMNNTTRGPLLSQASG